ncbi:MAG: hypothetical protein XU14_C0068G0009 [Armatimonadetes bacterium CSP1-3]|nr:MAG: hypothetical protein XU14_C0068G0009 [Armatimonadetes bacterium CSP1-3]
MTPGIVPIGRAVYREGKQDDTEGGNEMRRQSKRSIKRVVAS